LEKVPRAAEKVYFVAVGRIFCGGLLNPFDLQYKLILRFPYRFFIWITYLFLKVGC
jgi:hypothetical protein